jgi:competence protein ComEA
MMRTVSVADRNSNRASGRCPEHDNFKEGFMRVLRRLLVVCLLLVPVAAISDPLVNINTADSERLVDDLVGIGPQKALAIVQYRQQHGPFKEIEDLALVSGIGAKTVEQNRDRMTVTAAETKP